MSGQPWIVADMDNGVLRIEATRADALDWAQRDACADRVQRRHDYGNHTYGYELTDAGRDETAGSYFIGRIDCLARHGYDPKQPPLYPVPGEPYMRVEPALDVTAAVADAGEPQAMLDAWLAAAASAGLTVEDSHVSDAVEMVPTEAKVGGRWYELTCWSRNRDDNFMVSARRG